MQLANPCPSFPTRRVAVAMILALLAGVGVVGVCTATTGCQTNGTAVPSDPIKDNARRSLMTAWGAVNAFLAADAAADAAGLTVPADIRAAADKLRDDGPTAYNDATEAITLYERTRKAADAATAEERLNTLSGMASDARKFLARLNERQATK